MAAAVFCRLLRPLTFTHKLVRSSHASYYQGKEGPITKDGVYVVDLRSDTLTQPSQEMRRVMSDAAVGDDVLGEDPTVKALQEKVAKMFRMEAALFVPTGTMGNLISIMGHCSERGMETLVGDKSHIYLYEQGGIAQLAGVHPRTVTNFSDGRLDLDELRLKIRPETDPHQPLSRLICLENTHNVCGGKSLPLSYIQKVSEISKENGLALHMDGARLMNAAVAEGVSPAEILNNCDSVNMCFSKGLGAPVGSVIAGTKEFIDMAIRIRKVLGGGMRQVGVLAAAAMFALDRGVPQLQLDHARAKAIAHALVEADQDVMSVDLTGVHTNIVMIDTLKPSISAELICRRFEEVTEQEVAELGHGISVKTIPFTHNRMRYVTHQDVAHEDIEMAIKKMIYVAKELSTVKADSDQHQP